MLEHTLSSLHRHLNEKAAVLLDTLVHTFQPGEQVCIRTWKDKPLKECWKGLYLILLITPADVKVKGVDSWIHYTWVKSAPLKDWTWRETAPLNLKLTRN